MQHRLLLQRMGGAADVEPARRHVDLGIFEPQAGRVTMDRGGRFDVVLDALHRRPQAGKARQGETRQAVVEDLLHAGRIEDRDHRVDEGEFRLVRRRRGFAGVIVAHQRQHAAIARGARQIGVAEGVAGAVDARPLAVPYAEDAIVAPLAADLGLLRAPQGRRSEVLVQRRLEDDAVLRQHRLGPGELLVETSQRRTAIAGDIAGGVEPGPAVPRRLHQGQSDDRLAPRQEDVADVEIVLVVERNGACGHGAMSSPGRHAGEGSPTRSKHSALLTVLQPGAVSVKAFRDHPATDPAGLPASR